MKQKLLFLASACFIAANSFATTFTITVGPGGTNTFSPSSGIVAHPGDVITWVWASGTHTTTSLSSIPAGATPWNHSMASASDVFSYTVSVIGTYNYDCNFHGTAMSGSFTVVSSTNIPAVSGGNSIFTIYPNPASASVHMQFNTMGLPVSVALIDMTGKEVLRNEYNNLKETDIDLQSIPAGMYIISAAQNNIVCKQRLIIGH